MPIYDYLCVDCGQTTEVLVFGDSHPQDCTSCGGSHLKKLLSVPSSLSGATAGAASSGLPGTGDTACCGTSPGHAGCAGPGSCCGRS